MGWWPLPLYAIVLATFATIDRRIRASPRAEFVVAANVLLVMALMGASAALTGGPESPVLTWLIIPVSGEEFLVLLPGIDLIEGVEIAQHLRDAVQGSQAGGLLVTGSFGVSVATGEGIEFLTLYRAADEAMYQAKAEGRNRVVAFRQSPALAA